MENNETLKAYVLDSGLALYSKAVAEKTEIVFTKIDLIEDISNVEGNTSFTPDGKVVDTVKKVETEEVIDGDQKYIQMSTIVDSKKNYTIGKAVIYGKVNDFEDKYAVVGRFGEALAIKTNNQYIIIQWNLIFERIDPNVINITTQNKIPNIMALPQMSEFMGAVARMYQREFDLFTALAKEKRKNKENEPN